MQIGLGPRSAQAVVWLPIACALLILSAYNLWTTCIRLGIIGTDEIHKEVRNYTYIGSDFPPILPLARPQQPVLLTFEDTSAYYPISGANAAQMWLSSFPVGYGFVRLGPQKRTLCVSMFHQLHCVEKLRIALDNPDDPIAGPAHLQHCLNFLRQAVLCAADLTLEPAPEGGDVSLEGFGVTHTCRDWEVVYETFAENYREWGVYFRNKTKEDLPGTA